MTHPGVGPLTALAFLLISRPSFSTEGDEQTSAIAGWCEQQLSSRCGRLSSAGTSLRHKRPLEMHARFDLTLFRFWVRAPIDLVVPLHVSSAYKGPRHFRTISSLGATRERATTFLFIL